ncbi:MAG: PucR family transcriptional regulator, partial [Christensenellaceae bacterium]|nr:PucR family transcriptional regulator [Christensenellaceae bacterium]
VDLNIPLKNLSTTDVKVFGKQAYLITSTKQKYIISTDQSENSKDILLLADSLLSLSEDKVKKISNKKDAYQYIISSNDISANGILEISTEFSLPKDKPFCVFFINFKNANAKPIAILKELYPSKTQDVYFSLNNNSVAVIHYTEDYSISDLIDFVNAFAETLQVESGEQFTIGVSDLKQNILEIKTAFLEAKKSINIGDRLSDNKTIYMYSTLLLERIALELPPNIRRNYFLKLFNKENEKLLNEEILSTINVFLSKDLNLSDASRHLYIHRNTLVYRLDKIQKTIGLDLRKFNDATVFKFLSTLKKLTRLDKE